MSSTFPPAVYNFIAFIFLILSFFSSSGKYTLNNMFEKVWGDIYYFCNWFWFWAQRKQKDQNSVSKMGTFIFRNLWFITWSRYLKTEHGSFAQGCISLSFRVVLFFMSDGEFPGQNIQYNSKGTGYYWYTQCNCIRARPSQAPSSDSGKRQRPSPAQTFQENLFHSLNQSNTSFSVFTPFLPSFSCLAGATFFHTNSSLDNYVSNNPCKGREISRENK